MHIGKRFLLFTQIILFLKSFGVIPIESNLKIYTCVKSKKYPNVQKTFLVNEENKNTLISLNGKDIAFKKFLFSSSEMKKNGVKSKEMCQP